MEQRWKWEASFICGEKASFVQYLLDNYTERDLVDMVTDIEDTKKAIDCQEKEMETGILYSDLEDKPYSWQSIKNRDGVSVYQTKEEFEYHYSEVIEENRKLPTEMQHEFKNLWEDYINDPEYHHTEGCTFDWEIRYVWRWCYDYQKILQIQDDIIYITAEEYFSY